MNSFEAARRGARELRMDLIEAGAAPDLPLELVLAAIGRMKLGVVWLQLGDPALNGAVAVLDAQAAIVKCADIGTPGERALVLAHEVAHEAVHRLLSGGLSGTSAGSAQVTDYGPRERRELEAEVFARELLFPENDAREFFLRGNATATDLSLHLGLPRGVVERQLLDALLLPEAPAGSVAAGPPAPPDASQVAAASHAGGPLLLQAGPGTGKTSTLVARVLHLVEHGADPATILVLTFSKRAASEVAERICRLLPEAGPRVWVGTFHQFGMDLVARHHGLLGLPAKPSLFDACSAVELLEDILPTLGLVHHRELWEPALVLKEIFRAISRAKDEMVGPKRYSELAENMRLAAANPQEHLAAERAAEVARVYACYQEQMRAHGGLDYGDQVMLPALLCEADDQVLAGLRARHRHVLVDEYQDVNRASITLLRSLVGAGGGVWAVGDPRQAIYRFRGASATSMARFGEDFGPFASAQLSVNYRSSEEVVSTFLGFASDMTAGNGMPRLSLSVRRGPSGLRPEAMSFETDAQEIGGLIGSVDELVAAGLGYGSQAVLCGTNAKVDEIAAALERAGIPVLHLGDLFERDEIRDLLSLLSLAADATGAGLSRIAAFDRYGLSLPDIRLVAAALRPETGVAALEAIGSLDSVEGLSASGAQGLRRLREDLAGLDVWSTPWNFLTAYMLDRTDWLARLASGDAVADRMRCLAVWRFMEFVREQPPGPAGQPIRRLLDRVRRAAMLGDARALGEVPEAARHLDAVRVMTVHGSKGLEFEAVHVQGLHADGLPARFRAERCPPPVGLVTVPLTGSRTSAEDEAATEQECLFFVAVSRARTRLRLYRSVASKATGGIARKPSPYLARVSPFIDLRTGTPGRVGVPALTPPIGVRWTKGVPVVAGHHLSLYTKCPRRLFHTLVLGIKGARKTGPFARTHDCAQRLLDRLKNSGGGAPPSLAQLEAEFETIWQEHGPHDHAFADSYRNLGATLVASLHASMLGRPGFSSTTVEVSFPNGRVLVQVDDLVHEADGTHVFRRVRTGTDPGETASENDILHVLLHMAAAERSRPYRIEAAHLTDGQLRPVPLTARKLKTRVETAEAAMAGLSEGAFQAKKDARVCPRCPHWFACGSLPPGSITL